MTTIKELRETAPGGLLTNDRGNGCSGPGYIEEISAGELDCDDNALTAVTETEDPEAWGLLRDSAKLQPGCDPNITVVFVGEKGDGDNGYQLVVGY